MHMWRRRSQESRGRSFNGCQFLSIAARWTQQRGRIGGGGGARKRGGGA